MNLGRVLLAAVLVAWTLNAGWAADDGKSDKGNDKPAKKEVVDFRKLKEIMPEKLGGLKRTECTGEKIKAGEMTLSTAKARYAPEAEKDDAPNIRIEIIDYSGAGEMAQGMAIWSKMEIDKETDNGYERTVKISGHPGFETWNQEDKSGNLHIFVAGRFIMNIQTENLPAEQIKKTAEAFPLDKLAKLDSGK